MMVARREKPADTPHRQIEAAIYDGLRQAGGAFSAEHGIGLDKLDAMARHCDPGKLATMRRLKAACDVFRRSAARVKLPVSATIRKS